MLIQQHASRFLEQEWRAIARAKLYSAIGFYNILLMFHNISLKLATKFQILNESYFSLLYPLNNMAYEKKYTAASTVVRKKVLSLFNNFFLYLGKGHTAIGRPYRWMALSFALVVVSLALKYYRRSCVVSCAYLISVTVCKMDVSIKKTGRCSTRPDYWADIEA